VRTLARGVVPPAPILHAGLRAQFQWRSFRLGDEVLGIAALRLGEVVELAPSAQDQREEAGAEQKLLLAGRQQ
jgi:hypothetical protein